MNLHVCRLLPAILPLTLLFGGCNSSPEQSHSDTVDSTQLSAPETAGNLRRRQIDALQELRKQLDDTTGLAFANVFGFPVPEDRFYPFIEQESFRKEYEKGGQRLSKDLFLQYFPEISQSIELPEFRKLFRQIPPERLQGSDSVRAEERMPNEKCFRYYHVQISGNDLSIQYGSDHDANAASNENEEAVVCEWATMWTFRFDGNTWRFVNMQQAG